MAKYGFELQAKQAQEEEEAQRQKELELKEWTETVYLDKQYMKIRMAKTYRREVEKALIVMLIRLEIIIEEILVPKVRH